MTYFLRRAIKAALFLLSFHSSFAVIRYVNINNPTPGAGTSWATAYTGYSIYAGFNGTETVVTQANPTLYPTILSGDIFSIMKLFRCYQMT